MLYLRYEQDHFAILTFTYLNIYTVKIIQIVWIKLHELRPGRMSSIGNRNSRYVVKPAGRKGLAVLSEDSLSSPNGEKLEGLGSFCSNTICPLPGAVLTTLLSAVHSFAA